VAPGCGGRWHEGGRSKRYDSGRAWRAATAARAAFSSGGSTRRTTTTIGFQLLHGRNTTIRLVKHMEIFSQVISDAAQQEESLY
jgi:hypothetical protein